MSALWSPQQREWLQAMGHQVWALGGAQSIEATSTVDVGNDDSSAQARREAAALLKGEVAPRARPSAPAPAPRVASSERLLMAVFRAAGRNSGDADVLALVPDPSALRTGTAKRALWPSLRALRRRSDAR